ncbi:hypothetical protein SEER_04451 [Salmonella enterica subsp. enterica serovar Rissen str. 150]|nr:hypothetical protein SEER_04451 [Salmonella enterica subsp. enterica serovar Rissen str. 150]
MGLDAKTVYPRWRGEHRARRLPSSVIGGLSPLARGTHALPLPEFLN